MELHLRMIILFLVMVPSAAEEEKSELTGVQGGSVTFPDPVMELGFVIFGGKTIAMVNDRKFKIIEETYKDRLFWNDTTGLFTLRGLQRSDSGVYTIDSKTEKVFTHRHKLTVYEPVSSPEVNTLNVSAESCTFLCSLNKAEETTLLWYKDQEILNQISSALSLPLTVHRQEVTSSYRCEARNPAEAKTLDIDVSSLCRGQEDKDINSHKNSRPWFFLSLTPLLLFCGAAAVWIIWTSFKRGRKKRREREEEEGRERDTVRADLH